jgi:hypothetical protein
MRTTTLIKGSRFGSTWFERYIPKEGTSKLKPAPTLSQICEVQKQQQIATLSLCLTHFEAELGYAPKIKFVLHKMNYNFCLRSNLITGTEVKLLLWSK